MEPGDGRDARGGAAHGQREGRGGHLQAVRAIPRPFLQAVQEEGMDHGCGFGGAYYILND